MAALREREFTLPRIKKNSVNSVPSSSSVRSLELGSVPLTDAADAGKRGSYGHALYAGVGEGDDKFSDFGGDSTASYEDDTAESIRRRAERAAEFEVEHNWMLKEAEERQYKKFDSIKRRVTILLPDDDPIENINHRLEEIRSMVKPKAEMSSFLKDLDPKQLDMIMKVTNTNVQQIKEERRKDWKLRDKLAYAINTVGLIARAAVPRRRHFNEDDPDVSTSVLRLMRRKQIEKNGPQKTVTKSSLSYDLQLALITQPEFRTKFHLKRVSWVLRATKAFKHMFPSEMDKEVARVVAYERYDDNRHIAYQGRPPERFYFVLSGRIQRLREYRLTSGCINKPMGTLSKGMASNPEDIESTLPSEFHLVAKGPVEVLMLHREDFIRLQHTTQNPPIDFLWSLDLFKEFPCDQFVQNHEAIEFIYYGQNRLIAKDAHNSPWIYVVKSGNVKVVRVQFVVDVRNDTTFANQNTEELGCGRAFSHASEMLGLLAKQRKMKSGSNVDLPELMKRRTGSVSIGSFSDRTHNRKKSRQVVSLEAIIDETPPTPLPEEDEVQSMSDSAHSSPRERKSNASSTSGSPEKKSKSDFQLPPIVVNKSRHASSTHSRGSAALIKSSSLIHGGGDLVQSVKTFITREKTEMDSGISPRRKKDQLQRRAYLLLDTLAPGDVFGLDDIAEKFRYHPTDEEGLESLDPPLSFMEGPAVSLVSDGSEVIKISKRFFLQFAQNNTMLRVETMQRQYISTDEAKSVMYDKETWSQYKTVLMERIVGSLTTRT